MKGKRAVVLGGVLLAVLSGAIGTYLLVPHRHAPAVADDASPEQVVEAYLDALRTHDCRTARELSTGINVRYSSSWCKQLDSITDVIVRPARQDDPITHGQSPSAEVVNVAVRFHLRWRPGVAADDPTVEDITDFWGYSLIRGNPGQPWRIFDQGVG
ncbi:hypothetical protein [Nocardioides ultimimeridianus]